MPANVHFGARHAAEKRRIEQPHLVAGCGRGLFPRSIKPLGDRFYRTFARRSVTHLLSQHVAAYPRRWVRYVNPLPGQGRPFSRVLPLRYASACRSSFPCICLASARGRYAAKVCIRVGETTFHACAARPRVACEFCAKGTTLLAQWASVDKLRAFLGPSCLSLVETANLRNNVSRWFWLYIVRKNHVYLARVHSRLVASRSASWERRIRRERSNKCRFEIGPVLFGFIGLRI